MTFSAPNSRAGGWGSFGSAAVPNGKIPPLLRTLRDNPEYGSKCAFSAGEYMWRVNIPS